MEITVGIDVSKGRLDVHVHPAGEAFAVGNDEAGLDARVIALFLAAVQPQVRALPDAQTAELEALMARRRQLMTCWVAERLRRQQAAPGRVRTSLARIVTTLEDELRALDSDIDTLVRGTPIWRDKEDLLASVPGTGKTISIRTDCWASAFTGTKRVIGRVTASQIASTLAASFLLRLT